MVQEFAQSVQDMISKDIGGIHTAVPGKILVFYPDTGLADVLPTMKFKKPDGKKIDYPKITGVPVVVPETMGQQATIAFPIKPGDGCLIVFAEQSLDYWQYGQETDTDLKFDLTNAVCIPGLFVPPNTVVKEACDNNAIIVDVEGTRITVKEDMVQTDVKGTLVTVKQGLVQIDSAKVIINGDVQLNGYMRATEDIIATNRISLTNHTHMGVHGETTPPM